MSEAIAGFEGGMWVEGSERTIGMATLDISNSEPECWNSCCSYSEVTCVWTLGIRTRLRHLKFRRRTGPLSKILKRLHPRQVFVFAYSVCDAACASL